MKDNSNQLIGQYQENFINNTNYVVPVDIQPLSSFRGPLLFKNINEQNSYNPNSDLLNKYMIDNGNIISQQPTIITPEQLKQLLKNNKIN